MFLYAHSYTGSLYKPTRPLGLIINKNGTYELKLEHKTRVCYLNKACFERSLLLDKNAFYKLHLKGRLHDVWKEHEHEKTFV